MWNPQKKNSIVYLQSLCFQQVLEQTLENVSVVIIRLAGREMVADAVKQEACWRFGQFD